MGPTRPVSKSSPNLAPALRGHLHSKLLICELVLADQNPEPVRVIRDIKILLIGGKWITYFNVIICFVGSFNF